MSNIRSKPLVMVMFSMSLGCWGVETLEFLKSSGATCTAEASGTTTAGLERAGFLTSRKRTSVSETFRGPGLIKAAGGVLGANAGTLPPTRRFSQNRKDLSFPATYW